MRETEGREEMGCRVSEGKKDGSGEQDGLTKNLTFAGFVHRGSATRKGPALGLQYVRCAW